MTRRPCDLWQGAALATFLALWLLPILAWVVSSAGTGSSSGPISVVGADESSMALPIHWITWGLLVAKTALLAAGGAVLATVLGAGQALLLQLYRVRGRGALAVFLLVPFITPPAVLTTAWHALVGGAAPSFLTAGPFAVVLLSGFHLSPVVLWVVSRHLDSLGGAEHEAMRLTLPPRRWLREIYLPAVRGVACGSGALVFLLLLPSREIAGYAGVDTAGDRILAAFTGAGDDGEGWALVGTLALVIVPLLRWIVVPLLVPASSPLSAPPHETRARAEEGRVQRQWPTLLLWAWVISGLLPLLALLFLAGSASVSTAGIWAAGLFWDSLRGVALALLLTAFGWVLAGLKRAWIWTLLLAPLFLPSTLAGLALLTGVQHWLPAWLAETPLLMSVAQFTRFAGVAVLLGCGARATIPRAELEAGQLLPGRIDRVATLLCRAAPTLAACVGVCFAMCLGEVESTALLVPPGYVSPVIELHQFLHFRHDAHAAQMAVGMVLVVVVWVLAAGAIQRRRLHGSVSFD